MDPPDEDPSDNDQRPALDDLVPRNYQLEMLEAVLRENSIVYLPTGAGKTFIAYLAMKHFSDKLDMPISAGGKRIFFVASMVALVIQQYNVIQRQSPFTVGMFNGAMNVDSWTKEHWLEQLESNEILVMSTQILLNIMDKGYMKMSNISLLVIDECHHATKGHPMSQLMKYHYNENDADMPRIMGLTATLTKTCVSDESALNMRLQELELNLHSKIVKHDNDDDLKGLYANPDIRVYQSPASDAAAEERAKKIEKILTNVPFLLQNKEGLDLFSLEIQKEYKELGYLLTKKGGINHDLQLVILDILHHLNNLDVFPAKLALKYHLARLKVLRKTVDGKKFELLNKMLEHLALVQEEMEEAMSPYKDNMLQMFHYSCPKVHFLFTVLAEETFKYKEDDFRLCGIVFTQRRVTAIILYHLMKIAMEHDQRFAQVKPDVILGCNKSVFGTMEYAWDSSKLRKSVARFNKGITNLCFATNVLEEGIDIPRCNIVVRFDRITTMTSFIQSKGRARDQKATFIVLDDNCEFDQKLPHYMEIEKVLKTIQTESDGAESLDSEKPLYRTVNGAIVTLQNSTRLLLRYCASLTRRRLAGCEPHWFFKSGPDKTVQVSLVLPAGSPHRNPIKGAWLKTLKQAKSSCCVEVLKLLHSSDELDDWLLPKRRTIEIAELNSKEVFKHYKGNDEGGQASDGAGNLRIHPILFPETLRDIAPVAGKEVYLHLLNFEPGFGCPVSNEQRGYLFDVTKSKTHGLAFLTSKPWPRLCKFPVYPNYGEITVEVVTNADTIKLSQEELEKVRQFNQMLFEQILELKHNFLYLNYESGNCNMLVAPTHQKVQGGIAKTVIDWSVLRSEIGVDLNCLEVCRKDGSQSLLGRVIVATHKEDKKDKPANSWKYIVTKVRDDMSPLSAFEDNGAYKDYAQYFKDKYEKIVTDKQPLLAVRPISLKLNMLTQGRDNATPRKCSRTFLIPELCSIVAINQIFSSKLWLKACMMPAVINRICWLLTADEFRRTINKETKIGVEELPEGMSWEPMDVKTFDIKYVTLPKANKFRKSQWKPHFNKNKIKEEDGSHLIDFHYNLLTVTDNQIEAYAELASKTLETSLVNSQGAFMERDNQIEVKPLSFLTVRSDIGPQLHCIYKALATTSANDAVDMERLEILGDSYLKYASAVYLYETHDNFSEGAMTEIKSKIVGNRNLYYCALKKDIQRFVHTHRFSPRTEWKPPNYEVSAQVKEAAKKQNFKQSALMEQLGVEIHEPTHTKHMRSYYLFVDMHECSDKALSDTVEALIGAYVESCGYVAAADLLAWFGIVPASLKSLLTKPPVFTFYQDCLDPGVELSSEINRFVPNMKRLEEVLGYKFQNAGYLLEALTHASCMSNQITASNERMEFLGDAVLDFLTTCHIYEHCGNLSPGVVTDVRSSIVNNNVFGSFVVRYGLHTFLLHNSSLLFGFIDNFVEHQQMNNHVIDDESLFAISEDNHVKVAKCVEIPKVLGDLWESVACAVYLDSGKDLVTTWNVFYPLMKNEIDRFVAKPPIQPFRLLLETYGNKNCTFEVVDATVEKHMVRLTVKYGPNIYTCHGMGGSLRYARNAASKYMLKIIEADTSNETNQKA
ncbi:endoribonuclease Dicer-like [Cloeon dipterum]|uniref:endoribonuclease Dicer-like n=1 Tax=Cloeon dipterum TaxID=197152 RepID=UPI00322049BB